MLHRSAVVASLLACASAAWLVACHDTPSPLPNPACHYAVTPAATPMPAAGGARQVFVTTDAACTWTFASNVFWISVGPDADSTSQPGTGGGSVIVTTVANGSSRRTGTAVIAGAVITVDQAGTAGSGCSVQVSPPEQVFTGGAAGTGQFAIVASDPSCGWTAARTALLEDTVDLTGGGAGGGREDRFGIGNATITYAVKAVSGTSPWPTGGGDIRVSDSALQVAATHHVALQ